MTRAVRRSRNIELRGLKSQRQARTYHQFSNRIARTRKATRTLRRRSTSARGLIAAYSRMTGKRGSTGVSWMPKFNLGAATARAATRRRTNRARRSYR